MGSTRALHLTLLLFCFNLRGEFYPWVHRFSGDNNTGRAIRLDAVGNVYVAGIFENGITIGTNHFVSRGETDLFVVKLSPDGVIQWAGTAGGAGSDDVARMTVSSNGTVFLCGTFVTNAFFGAHEVTAPTNDYFQSFPGTYITRLDDGAFTWVRALSAPFGATVQGIALAPGGDRVVVTGKRDWWVFLAEYDVEGVWNEAAFPNFPTNILGIAKDLAVTSDGDVVVAGTCKSFDLGGTNQSYGYLYDPTQFTLRVDATGNPIWGRLTRSSPSVGNAIAIASDGSVLTAGSVQVATFGLPYNYASLIKHSRDGEMLWLRTLGEHRGSYMATDLALDPQDNVLISGWAAGYYLSDGSRWGALIAGFDSSGSKFFERHIDSVSRSDDNHAAGIASDVNGDAYVTGWVKGTPWLGTNFMTSGAAGVANTFILRRSTLQPVLRVESHGEVQILVWPPTGVPFVLQERPSGETQSWSNVAAPMVFTNGRNEVTVPVNGDRVYRLVPTNEVPIRHAPSAYSFHVGGLFLDESAGTIIGRGRDSAAVQFTAYGSDRDAGTLLSFAWFDAGSGQQVVPTVTSTVKDDHHQTFLPAIAYNTTVMSAPAIYRAGRHTIALVVSDGEFAATNVTDFVVLGFEEALHRFQDRATNSVRPRYRKTAALRLSRFLNAMTANDQVRADREMGVFKRRYSGRWKGADGWNLISAADKILATSVLQPE